MGKPNQFTANQFIAAIPGTGGIVSAIAKKIGCDWHTARKYIDNHPTVKAAYSAECEAVLDLAEAKLIEQVQGGEGWAIKYLLSTKGKHRGYIERQEIEAKWQIEIIKQLQTGELPPDVAIESLRDFPEGRALLEKAGLLILDSVPYKVEADAGD